MGSVGLRLADGTGHTPSAPVVARLVDELVDRYQTLGVGRLRRELDNAIRDLTGSVHPDALAEMATRLVIYRLDHGRSRVVA